MKGIALSTLAYIILALISLIVVLSLIGNKIYPSLQDAYCKILIGVKSVLPLPTHMKTDLPMFCNKEDNENKILTEEIYTGDPDRIAFAIASYILACWEKASKIDDNILCYEIVLKNLDGIVTEDMIKEKLGDYSSILKWNVGDIQQPKSIGIFYNAEEKIIEVY
ncbi:MAG: hypothetical protein KQA41_00405 [Candidatus Aenigmarchaeota archaeon]|nr:hypothetical protein [Candidatus Aenigmarchaeota archaeon]